MSALSGAGERSPACRISSCGRLESKAQGHSLSADRRDKKLVRREKALQFSRGILNTVRAMRDVYHGILPKITADRTFWGFSRIRGSQELTNLSDGIVSLQGKCD